jgi:hypothetical protein
MLELISLMESLTLPHYTAFFSILNPKIDTALLKQKSEEKLSA